MKSEKERKGDSDREKDREREKKQHQMTAKIASTTENRLLNCRKNSFCVIHVLICTSRMPHHAHTAAEGIRERERRQEYRHSY